MILTPEQPTLALHARNAAESAHPELWRGLVGAWVPALGYQGQELFNLSRNANNGILKNDPRWTIGERGRALSFDGVDNYVDAGEIDNVLDDSNAFAVTVWLSADSIELGDARGGNGNTGSSLLTKTGSGGDNSFGLYLHDANEIAVYVDTGVNLDVTTSSNAVSTSRWHYVAATYDGSFIQLYVDGKEEAATAHTGTLVSNTNPLWIGAGRLGSTGILGIFEGDMKKVSVYNRTLTLTEIRTLYCDPLAPFRFRDDTALATAAMFGGTPSVTLPPPLFNMQMTGSF